MKRDLLVYFGAALLCMPLALQQAHEVLQCESREDAIVHLGALCLNIFAIGWCSSFGASALSKRKTQ